jgi:hypothetical protein
VNTKPSPQVARHWGARGVGLVVDARRHRLGVGRLDEAVAADRRGAGVGALVGVDLALPSSQASVGRDHAVAAVEASAGRGAVVAVELVAVVAALAGADEAVAADGAACTPALQRVHVGALKRAVVAGFVRALVAVAADC